MTFGASAQGKATNERLKCGPASWHNPFCPACKDGDKTYVTVKWSEAAIATAHEALKDLDDSKKEVAAITEVLGVPHTQQKRWTEHGEKKPETNGTYCWAPVKAEDIKPLKDKGYLLGSFYDGTCSVEGNRCYQVTMTCRRQRNEDQWGCNANLQEFIAKDGKCEDSPMAHACDCKPDKYWTCGAGKGAAAGKKGGRSDKRH